MGIAANPASANPLTAEGMFSIISGEFSEGAPGAC